MDGNDREIFRIIMDCIFRLGVMAFAAFLCMIFRSYWGLCVLVLIFITGGSDRP